MYVLHVIFIVVKHLFLGMFRWSQWEYERAQQSYCKTCSDIEAKRNLDSSININTLHAHVNIQMQEDINY